MRIVRLIGLLLVTLTPIVGTIYASWAAGLLGIDPELAVKVVVYVVVALVLAVAWLIGYVMVTAPKPVIVPPEREGGGSGD